MPITIVWHGHACFEIRNSVTVVIDPHDGSLGIKPPSAKADIVLISHRHFDHANGLSYVKKNDTIVINQPGTYEVKGIKVTGIATYHDDSRGAKRGPNTVYAFEMEGIKFCHLGDLGHVLTEDQVNALKPIDVLMVPVGGVFTIDAKQADEVVKLLSPRIVIPMHYKVPGLDLPIAGVEKFIAGKTNVEKVPSNAYEITKEALPKELKIVVLTPP
ncbi:MAG: MBL fold metallo-hydrolase [Candidatus Nezhaarchaeales archaeon]